MSASWQWDNDGTWEYYSLEESRKLETAFLARAAHQLVCNGGYKVIFSYNSNKPHVQQNTHTKFNRNVQRLGSIPKKQESTDSEPAVIHIDSDSDSEGFVVVPTKTPKKKKKKSENAMEIDLVAENPYPDATDANPVWDYVDPKSKEWVKFSAPYTKMVEGLSKRSAIFALNVPGLGGFQVALATMTMKATSTGENTNIRRTPNLKGVSAAPILPPISAATTASSAPAPGSKKMSKTGKSSSMGNVSDTHLFEVNADLVAKCKKATGWKNVTKKDAEKLKDSQCVICCDGFDDGRTVVHLSKCGSHYFHENCIAASFKPGFITCPVCQTIYGIRTGTQPKGTMRVTITNERLSGYPNCGCITIHYSFKDGIQEEHHPSPGHAYYGTSRTAYLPDNAEGRNVLKLLQLAFSRNLVFTIGTSVTTGAPNCVIWNGIHHKTSTSGGSTNFGYPDPTYLERVTDELKAKGVTLD